MTGVSVGGEFFAFDCEKINLHNKNLGEAALLTLLESFSRGEFTSVKTLHLVIAALASMHLLDLTLIQGGNAVGDIGAKMIGEGLKVNSSLQWLLLVRFFVFVGTRWAAGRGGGRLHSRVCCRTIIKLEALGLQG
jgi:hypothetical protein